jgi:hypothetical protein
LIYWLLSCIKLNYKNDFHSNYHVICHEKYSKSDYNFHSFYLIYTVMRPVSLEPVWPGGGPLRNNFPEKWPVAKLPNKILRHWAFQWGFFCPVHYERPLSSVLIIMTVFFSLRSLWRNYVWKSNSIYSTIYNNM